MKTLNNQKGFMSMFTILFILFIIGVFSVGFDFDNEKMAIAGDVKRGGLVETEKSKRIILEVDAIMENIKRFNEKRANSFLSGDIEKNGGYALNVNSWIPIFWAKVQLERARLEMEIAAIK